MTLAARDVRVDLSGQKILHGVSISIAPGEIVAIAGANGAGKSTLLRTMAGLKRPREGVVEVDGRPLDALDRRTLAREIAYLPQDRTVHWPVTVEMAVGLGRLPHRNASAAEGDTDRMAIASAMTAMDVERFAKRSITELSGGERARVLLARALAQEARFLLADEPAAGLDPAHGLLLFAHLARLAAEGKGVAVALHDLSFALRFATRVALLKDGRVMADGSPGDIVTEENLAAVYGIRATLGRIGGLPFVLPVEPLP